jgi:hypothetical protein
LDSIATKAAHALHWFERAIRSDRTGYYHVRDDAPPEAYDLVGAVTDAQWTLDDRRYQYICDALEILEEHGGDRHAAAMALEKYADVGQTALEAWLASHPARRRYVQSLAEKLIAREVMGPYMDTRRNPMRTIAEAQHTERREVLMQVRAWLEQH